MFSVIFYYKYLGKILCILLVYGCELVNDNVRNEQYKVYTLHRYCMQTVLTVC